MKSRLFSFKISMLRPYIDWSYLFHAWGIRLSGKESVEALQLKDDAMRLLDANGGEEVRALFRLCDAHSDGDNIILDGVRLPLLRQQHNIADAPNLCLSDFVSPIKDRVGLFATTVAGAFCDKYRGDDYRYLLMQTLCDRLAEAAASLLHSKVRREKELWGYSPDENFTPQQLCAEPFQGIRPAVGYPSLPDQSVIFIIDRLIGLEQIGVSLTESGAMHPHASVCGLMFAHPAARYFAVGRISDEQFADYACRRGMAEDELRRFLVRNV